MRRILTTMHVTLDGRAVRPDGRIDWVGKCPETYDFEAFDDCDACMLGRGMYPEYAQYWRGVAAGADATAEAQRYAEFADRTTHYVLSRTESAFDWPVARSVSGLLEVAALREQPGGDICVLGGATTVGTFIDAGLLDELRLTVHPLIIAEGTSLFDMLLTERQYTLAQHHALPDGSIRLVYRPEWSHSDALMQRCVAELTSLSGGVLTYK